MNDSLAKFYSTSLAYRDSLLKNESQEYTRYLSECSSGMEPGGAVLECGCGLGNSSRLLSERGFSVTGTDISPLFIEEARRRHGEGPDLRFAVEDTARLSFPDASFGLVCSALFLEHVTDVKAVLGEMYRVIKPGGRLVAVLPSFLDPFQQLKEFLCWPAGRKARPWEAPTRVGALWRFLYYSWLKVAKAAGMDTRIHYLEPVLDGGPGTCGNDYDSTWLANPQDVERLLKGLGMEVEIRFPDLRPGGAVGRFLARLPGGLADAYARTRASGFTVVARKPV